MSYLDTSAAAWLDRFMQAQAKIAAESMFVTFGLGQLGAIAQLGDAERAREMIDVLRSDAADIEREGKELAQVLRSILANVERSLPTTTATAVVSEKKRR